MRNGRLNQPAAELAQRYSESVSFDWLLYPYDIAGSIAHAAALARAGIITIEERQQIENELRVIEKEIESGKFEWDASLEDVHMNVEAALTKRTGAVGVKLHTARSRNDQIALDLRLYVKAEIAEVSGRLRGLQKDKKALFDSVDTTKSALEVFAAMLPELKINRERMENAARNPNLLGTDLAEYLVKKGTPFREAHQIVGELVVHSITKSVPLDQIGVAEMKKFSPHFDDDVAKIFDVRDSLAQRRAIGAPSPENIAAQIKRWKGLLVEG
jgi:argininosuccinate lyase